ncbi:MAG: T9SS type A sorting domain-containing protein [Bacteroidia bacterium]
MKLVRSQKPRLRSRQLFVATCSAFVLIAVGITLFFQFSRQTEIFAASTGEYRTTTSGNWNAAATWQRFNGSTWVAATGAPSSSDATITIQNGHTVTMTASATVDQVVIASGGTLVLNNGVTMTLANGAGTDLDVTGTFKSAGTVTISGSTIAFQNGGKYQHNFTTTAGTIPTATWNTGSTCEIIGYTTNSSAPSGLQAFSNFTWNCPSQASTINLNGGLTSVTGNFQISATGSGSNMIYLSNGSTTLNVGGDFTVSGGKLSLSNSSGATPSLTVNGNYYQTGGTISVVDGSGATGTFNLLGNFSHTGGTLTVGGNSSTSAQMVFKKAGTQTFTASSNTVSGNVDFAVNSGATLSLGTNIVTGRNFTLNSGGGIMLGSTAGITSSGASGNIQVSGTRSFNAGADYTYNGSAAQAAGNGLPASIKNLTINNGNSLTLNQNTTVTNIITLTSGKINTGSYELIASNTAAGAITGQSNTSYVYGNLRRSVSASGTYTFPVGSIALYEPATVTLSATTGFTSILGKFNYTNPNDTLNPLESITISGVDMEELLDYGYWTLTPNLPLLTGNYTVQVQEQGYANTLGNGTLFALLYRATSLLPWISSGTNNDATQTISGGVVTAARSAMAAFGEYAIALGDFAAFSNPSLISGTDGQVGAIYLFPNVMRLVDAWVYLVSTTGGATLNDIDDNTTGYNECFQPFIDYPTNSTAYIEWRIVFKKAGTTKDTTLRKMTATGVDVDGGSSGGKTIREFIDATMPTSYSLDPLTSLTITNLGGIYRAMGSTSTISSIDTSQKQAMYELSYNNVNSILYRTGAVTTYTSTQTRQTSLYFRSFNLTVRNIALPIKLTDFNAKLRQGVVKLNWSTSSETNNDHFTIERSADGEEFAEVGTVRGSGTTTVTHNYSFTDDNPLSGVSYYRLKQTDYDGKFTYSDVKSITNNSKELSDSKLEIESVSPNPFTDHLTITFNSKEKGEAQIVLLNSAGQELEKRSIEMNEGSNTIELNNLDNINRGICIMEIISGNTKVVRKVLHDR